MNAEEKKAKAETLAEIAKSQQVVEFAKTLEVQGEAAAGTIILVAAVLAYKAAHPDTTWTDGAQEIASAVTASCWLVWGVDKMLAKETKQ